MTLIHLDPFFAVQPRVRASAPSLMNAPFRTQVVPPGVPVRIQQNHTAALSAAAPQTRPLFSLCPWPEAHNGPYTDKTEATLEVHRQQLRHAHICQGKSPEP